MKTYQKSFRDIIKAKFVALKWTSQENFFLFINNAINSFAR
jgi:hypothetical protein